MLSWFWISILDNFYCEIFNTLFMIVLVAEKINIISGMLLAVGYFLLSSLLLYVSW